jgi:cytochrome c553
MFNLIKQLVEISNPRKHAPTAAPQPAVSLRTTSPSARARIKRPLLLLPLALLLGAAAPSGAAIALHGTSQGALPCQACHGMQFQGNAAIGAPALAGLSADVTLNSLQMIASGSLGQNVVMKSIAMSLTPAEREAVAAYFASLPAPK